MPTDKHLPLHEPNNEPGIHFVVRPAPQWGSLGYEAQSSCLHGKASFIMFSKPEVLEEQARNLGPSHGLQTGCDCPLVCVYLENAEEAQD